MFFLNFNFNFNIDSEPVSQVQLSHSSTETSSELDKWRLTSQRSEQSHAQVVKLKALKPYIHQPPHLALWPMNTAFKIMKPIYYWYSLTINIKLKPRSAVAADGPLLVSCWAAVLPAVWGWRWIDGKHICVLVKRHILTSMDLLSIFVPCERPVWAAIHHTAQPYTLRGEHIQPRRPVLHFWRRNF